MHMYVRMLRKFVDQTDSVLVVGGGSFDRDCLLAAGVRDAVISNLERHGEVAPYEWRCLDAERIDIGDGSFDWVVIHAALHHLAVPAMGVCEMFRVARKGILCIEARDSALMRLASRFGLVPDYELVTLELGSGGRRNSIVPNYVYRWTERDFEKVIKAFAPAYQHRFEYDYGFRIPPRWEHRPLLRALIKGLDFVARKQGNQFACVAFKNVALQPWMKPLTHSE